MSGLAVSAVTSEEEMLSEAVDRAYLLLSASSDSKDFAQIFKDITKIFWPGLRSSVPRPINFGAAHADFMRTKILTIDQALSEYLTNYLTEDPICSSLYNPVCQFYLFFIEFQLINAPLPELSDGACASSVVSEKKSPWLTLFLSDYLFRSIGLILALPCLRALLHFCLSDTSTPSFKAGAQFFRWALTTSQESVDSSLLRQTIDSACTSVDFITCRDVWVQKFRDFNISSCSTLASVHSFLEASLGESSSSDACDSESPSTLEADGLGLPADPTSREALEERLSSAEAFAFHVGREFDKKKEEIQRLKETIQTLEARLTRQAADYLRAKEMASAEKEADRHAAELLAGEPLPAAKGRRASKGRPGAGSAAGLATPAPAGESVALVQLKSELTARQEEIRKIQEALEAAKLKIAELERQLSQVVKEKQGLQARVRELDLKIESLSNNIFAKEAELLRANKAHEDKLKNQKGQIRALEAKLISKESLEGDILRMREEIESQLESMALLRRENEGLQARVSDGEGELRRARGEIAVLRSQAEEAAASQVALNLRLEAKDVRIAELELSVGGLSERCEGLLLRNQVVQENEAVIVRLRFQLDSLRADVAARDAAIAAREAAIAGCQAVAFQHGRLSGAGQVALGSAVAPPAVPGFALMPMMMASYGAAARAPARGGARGGARRGAAGASPS